MTFPDPGTSRARRVAETRTELESIIRDAWANYAESGSERDAEIARLIEADARERLDRLPALPIRPKLKTSKKAKKRKAFKRCIRLEPVQNLLSTSARKARWTNCRLVLRSRSQFFHSLRHFSSQANDRSTIHRFGSTSKR